MIEDDDYELASAYSDGELDAAQRTVVENDPRLVSVVQEIEALRNRLIHADDALPSGPVDNDVKTKHLAVAGAAFDDLYGETRPETPTPTPSVSTNGSTPAPSANIIDLRNRRRYRVLSMAAGFVVVAGIGAVAISGVANRGSSEDSAETAAMVEETQALDAPMAASEAATDTTEAMADDSAMNDSAASADAPAEDSAGESERPTATTPEGAPIPNYAFPATTTLREISDELAIVSDDGYVPYLDGCASPLFELDTIDSAIPILLGEATVEYFVTFENDVFTAHLVDAECVELEQLVLQPDG